MKTEEEKIEELKNSMLKKIEELKNTPISENENPIRSLRESLLVLRQGLDFKIQRMANQEIKKTFEDLAEKLKKSEDVRELQEEYYDNLLKSKQELERLKQESLANIQKVYDESKSKG